MFLNWLGHPNFQPYEQLMGVVYELGIVTSDQLQTITGLTPSMLNKCIRKIRLHADKHEERDLWIRKFTLPSGKLGGYQAAYALGRLGVQYVLEMGMNEGGRAKVSPQSQIQHYLGVNDVLSKLISSGIDRDRIVWRSSLKATEELLMFWDEGGKLNDEDKSKRKFIRPDARLWIDDCGYWIEFDNDTEGARKIDQKFIRYKETLTPKFLDQLPKEINTPIIWITISEERKNYLSDRWNVLSQSLETPIPTMHFFVQGEETEFFLINQRSSGSIHTEKNCINSVKTLYENPESIKEIQTINPLPATNKDNETGEQKVNSKKWDWGC